MFNSLAQLFFTLKGTRLQNGRLRFVSDPRRIYALQGPHIESSWEVAAFASPLHMVRHSSPLG